jgi:glutamyl-tRNA synthetase
LTWAKEFQSDFAALLESAPDYAKAILAIGRGGAKPRKDFTTWADVAPYMAPFYDDTFQREAAYPEQFDRTVVSQALALFLETYDPADTSDLWFAKIKDVAQKLGFAPETKLYKQNPQDYRGHVGDISAFIRIALTGRTNSPDMYTVMQILGEDRVRARIQNQIEA